MRAAADTLCAPLCVLLPENCRAAGSRPSACARCCWGWTSAARATTRRRRRTAAPAPGTTTTAPCPGPPLDPTPTPTRAVGILLPPLFPPPLLDWDGLSAQLSPALLGFGHSIWWSMHGQNLATLLYSIRIFSSKDGYRQPSFSINGAPSVLYPKVERRIFSCSMDTGERVWWFVCDWSTGL